MTYDSRFSLIADARLMKDRTKQSGGQAPFVIAASLAPAVGFEPTTNRLTADRSTTELRWIAI